MQKRRTKAKSGKLFTHSRRRIIQRNTHRKIRMRRYQFHLDGNVSEAEQHC